MNTSHFGDLARVLTDGAITRRAVMRGMAGALGAAGLSHAGLTSLQAKKGKRRKQPSPVNRFGCRNVGVACSSANQCCSGICEGGRGKDKNGKKRRRTCRAHDTGGCKVSQDSCSTSTNFTCTTVTGEAGFCHLTTGNAPYCAFDGIDSECTRDEDCIDLCGPQAACSVCAEPGLAAFRFCAGPSRCEGFA